MVTRSTLALAFACGLLLAGCGGSASTATSTPPGTSTSSAAKTGTTGGGAPPASTGTTKATSTQTAPRSTASRKTSTVTTTRAATAPLPTPADYVPATFVITRRGALSPPTVSAAASVAIKLTVVSGDGKAHRAVLESAPPHSLSVPAGRSASVLLADLRSGRYKVRIDGVAQGTLVIGFLPGP